MALFNFGRYESMMGTTYSLIDTARVSKSKSLRMSLPRRVAERLEIGPEGIIGFFATENGEIVIRKLQ